MQYIPLGRNTEGGKQVKRPFLTFDLYLTLPTLLGIDLKIRSQLLTNSQPVSHTKFQPQLFSSPGKLPRVRKRSSNRFSFQVCLSVSSPCLQKLFTAFFPQVSHTLPLFSTLSMKKRYDETLWKIPIFYFLQCSSQKHIVFLPCNPAVVPGAVLTQKYSVCSPLFLPTN